MSPLFVDFKLELPELSFDSPLTDVVMELEQLRRLTLRGDTPAPIFFQLKNIFQLLESLGSARIEGNHTTLADYIEVKIEDGDSKEEGVLEIQNIEHALEYIEQTIKPEEVITEAFIRELHALAVKDLVREGDKTPGQYRVGNVKINGSTHMPPDHLSVSGYMHELVDFINRDDARKYDLLKIAMTHHRFSWVHPFSNGNGRVNRLLSYALLIKEGFNVSVGGRVLNPTAVFCMNRDLYYSKLNAADQGNTEALQDWCLYVLSGIETELEKVDQLTKYDYLKKEILYPALAHSKQRQLVNDVEYDVLHLAIELGQLKSDDIATKFPDMTPRMRSYLIKKLIDAKLIKPIKQGSRIYSINFINNSSLRSVVKLLEEKGFIPPFIKSPENQRASPL